MIKKTIAFHFSVALVGAVLLGAGAPPGAWVLQDDDQTQIKDEAARVFLAEAKGKSALGLTRGVESFDAVLKFRGGQNPDLDWLTEAVTVAYARKAPAEEQIAIEGVPEALHRLLRDPLRDLWKDVVGGCLFVYGAFRFCGPNALIDKLWQQGLKVAYWMHLVVCFVLRPTTHGVYVAIWHGERVLLIKNSYRRCHTFPGGGRKGGEESAATAVRELHEEIGLRLDRDALTFVETHHSHCEFKKDSIDLFEVRLSEEPALRVDNREVVEAEFLSAGEALGLKLFPTVENYLQCRAEGARRRRRL